ncbi:hypothetical protein LZ32DRAFT_242541 [Colletotrichum eremochloae]|nr:hypothetical protein LZ32DRAFT_242541 [Colletotrichum eremochloae]
MRPSAHRYRVALQLSFREQKVTSKGILRGQAYTVQVKSTHTNGQNQALQAPRPPCRLLLSPRHLPPERPQPTNRAQRTTRARVAMRQVKLLGFFVSFVRVLRVSVTVTVAVGVAGCWWWREDELETALCPILTDPGISPCRLSRTLFPFAERQRDRETERERQGGRGYVCIRYTQYRKNPYCSSSVEGRLWWRKGGVKTKFK